MVTFLLRLLRLLPLLCGGHRHVALENLALHHQLAVFEKTVTRPKVRRSDRRFWVARQKLFGFRGGAPRQAGATESKYLLTGLAQWTVCGGSTVQ